MLRDQCNPNDTDATGRTPLHEASSVVSGGSSDPAVVGAVVSCALLLLQAGANVNAPTVGSRTPMHELFAKGQDDAPTSFTNILPKVRAFILRICCSRLFSLIVCTSNCFSLSLFSSHRTQSLVSLRSIPLMCMTVARLSSADCRSAISVKYFGYFSSMVEIPDCGIELASPLCTTLRVTVMLVAC